MYGWIPSLPSLLHGVYELFLPSLMMSPPPSLPPSLQLRRVVKSHWCRKLKRCTGSHHSRSKPAQKATVQACNYPDSLLSSDYCYNSSVPQWQAFGWVWGLVLAAHVGPCVPFMPEIAGMPGLFSCLSWPIFYLLGTCLFMVSRVQGERCCLCLLAGHSWLLPSAK